jgi:hypothetical protein
MKSSWRSPDGGSSVAPKTKIEPSEAVFCAWWATDSTLSGVFIKSRKLISKILHSSGANEPGSLHCPPMLDSVILIVIVCVSEDGPFLFEETIYDTRPPQ